MPNVVRMFPRMIATALCALAVAAPAWGALDESASTSLVLPLVVAGPDRESSITISNAATTPVTVHASYRGAEDGPLPVSRFGPLPCDDVTIDPEAWVDLPLSDLCPRLRSADVEHLGYLVLGVESDAWTRISAAQLTRTRTGARFRIEAEPLGALDIAAPSTIGFIGGVYSQSAALRPLRVHGLRAVVPRPGQPGPEIPRCWIAAPESDKRLELSVLAAGLGAIGQPVAVTLRSMQMQVVDVLRLAQVRPGTYQNLTVYAAPAPGNGGQFDRGAVVFGCGTERPADHAVDFTMARTDGPADASRRRLVYADNTVSAGPYKVAVVLRSSAIDRTFPDEKVVLSLLVQPEDRIECRLVHEDPGFLGLMDWLELQVKDAAGSVVAGGDEAKGTGVFETGPHDRSGGALDGPWQVEVSWDEAALIARGPPTAFAGAWGVQCQSAAGMSQPVLAIDQGTALHLDDF